MQAARAKIKFPDDIIAKPHPQLGEIVVALMHSHNSIDSLTSYVASCNPYQSVFSSL